MRSASVATAESDLDCKIFLLPRAMFIDMSAVVTATFYVATVDMHKSLIMVAKVLACLQHHVQSEDVPLLERNIEQTITSNNAMFTFHTYWLDSLLQDT